MLIALIKNGADVNFARPKAARETPLIAVVFVGSEEAVDWLIAHGALAGQLDKRGFTAAYYAKQRGLFQIERKLLSKEQSER
jgi:hypothetical protein